MKPLLFPSIVLAFFVTLSTAFAQRDIEMVPARAYTNCESGHWIESVLSDGEIVKLEDGSIWEIDSAGAIDSALWLPTTNIIACDDKLINTDDNETVSAQRIR